MNDRQVKSCGTCPSCALAILFGVCNAAQAQTVPACAADFDGSGAVGPADLAELLASWGPCRSVDCPADIVPAPEGDGDVGPADLGQLLASWGEVALTPCASVASIFPPAGVPGTSIVLQGEFPDPDRRNYCVVGMSEDGTTIIPFDVLSVSPTQLVAAAGAFSAEAQEVHVMVGLGEGGVVDVPRSPQYTLGSGTWAWRAIGEGFMTDATFTPIQPLEPIPVSGVYTGQLINGDVQVTITGDCPAGTKARVWPRAHHYEDPNNPNDSYVGLDAFIPCIQTSVSLTEAQCAAALCNAVEALYAAADPPIEVDCTTAPAPGGGITLTLSLPGLDISWGMFTIEVLAIDTGPRLFNE